MSPFECVNGKFVCGRQYYENVMVFQVGRWLSMGGSVFIFILIDKPVLSRVSVLLKSAVWMSIDVCLVEWYTYTIHILIYDSMKNARALNVNQNQKRLLTSIYKMLWKQSRHTLWVWVARVSRVIFFRWLDVTLYKENAFRLAQSCVTILWIFHSACGLLSNNKTYDNVNYIR